MLSSYCRERLGISTNILAVTSILTSSAPIPLCRRKGGGGHCWFNNHTLDKLWALGRLHWAKLPAHHIGASLSCPKGGPPGNRSTPSYPWVCPPSGHLYTFCATLPGSQEVAEGPTDL